jgi:hypothetical protein
MNYTIYDTETGRIVLQGETGDIEGTLNALPGNQTVLWGERVDDARYYLPAGVITPRPTLECQTQYSIPADGVAEVAFALPVGSKVFCPEDDLEWLDEDEFGFTTNVVGTRVYKIEPAFPYQSPVWVNVHAT